MDRSWADVDDEDPPSPGTSSPRTSPPRDGPGIVGFRGDAGEDSHTCWSPRLGPDGKMPTRYPGLRSPKRRGRGRPVGLFGITAHQTSSTSPMKRRSPTMRLCQADKNASGAWDNTPMSTSVNARAQGASTYQSVQALQICEAGARIPDATRSPLGHWPWQEEPSLQHLAPTQYSSPIASPCHQAPSPTSALQCDGNYGIVALLPAPSSSPSGKVPSTIGPPPGRWDDAARTSAISPEAQAWTAPAAGYDHVHGPVTSGHDMSSEAMALAMGMTTYNNEEIAAQLRAAAPDVYED